MTPHQALAELIRFLKAANYHFVAVTPATHARVLSRPPSVPLSIRDIFGWNRWFPASALSPAAIALLQAANALDLRDGMLRSRVRAASLDDELLLHSSYPTDAADAVFFGPDTYRFTRFIQHQLPRLGPAEWLVDMGAGSGAGAIAAAKLRNFTKIMMVDCNPRALDLARVNAQAACVAAEALLANVIPDGADLVVANPPYMFDAAGRAYRHGGGQWGGAVSIEWARQAIARLAPGGAMLLYTGAAYVDGESPLIVELGSVCRESNSTLELSEIDPDVFGDELDQPQYERVERIAAVGAVIRI